jgi:hypothetical protein
MSEITFKRFPESKQEQIRQFVSYAQMCGLSGKDIRSIGDKLDRERRTAERNTNMEIVRGFDCLYIGGDRDFEERFKLKTAQGAYNFVRNYDGWHITSLRTKQTVVHRVDIWDYELPKRSWTDPLRYAILLDISAGKLRLDF